MAMKNWLSNLINRKGDVVDQSKLGEELAAPTLIGLRNAWFPSVANELTPERLASVLVGVDTNDIQDYLTLAEEMEERDLHYHSVLGTRKMAVSGLEVMVESPTDDKEDMKITEFVADTMKSEVATELVTDLLDALGKGFSVNEIMWDRTGAKWIPSEYIWRDPRFFQFDRETGNELRLRDEANPADGIALEPFKFIQHRPKIKNGLPIRGGLARLAVVSYMCKSYTLKDWLAFMEVFGMPIRVGKFGPGASDEQKLALLQAVARIGIDASCIIPEGMLIEFIDGVRTEGGNKLFQGAADWFDSQVSKGVLGQTMTADEGGSLAQAQVHDQVRGDILVHDAKQMSATLRRDIVRPLVDLNFGPRDSIDAYPKVRVVIEDPEDLKLLSESLPPFIDRGLEVEKSVILDLFGLPEPAEGVKPEDLLGARNVVSVPAALVPVPGVENEDAEAEAEAAARETTALLRELTGKIRKGEKLSADQRAFLSVALAAEPIHDDDDDPDMLDDEAEKALEEWRPIMNPILQPILDHAKASSSYEEFLKGLDKVMASSVDSTLLVQSIATEMFKARGVGEDRDEPVD